MRTDVWLGCVTGLTMCVCVCVRVLCVAYLELDVCHALLLSQLCAPLDLLGRERDACTHTKARHGMGAGVSSTLLGSCAWRSYGAWELRGVLRPGCVRR